MQNLCKKLPDDILIKIYKEVLKLFYKEEKINILSRLADFLVKKRTIINWEEPPIQSTFYIINTNMTN